MKRSAQGSPKVEKGKSRMFDPAANEDWYTPDVFRLHPQEVRVWAGKDGKGQALVQITEGEYERGHVMLFVGIESIPIRHKGRTISTGMESSATRFSKFDGASGPHVVQQIDNLIEALTVARREAAKLGLFTRRRTPRSIQEVEAAVGGG